MSHYKGDSKDSQRTLHLQKKREQQLEVLEKRKEKIAEQNLVARIDTKFMAHYDAVEATLKTSTVGLVTLDEMRAKQEHFVREREKQLAREEAAKLHEEQEVARERTRDKISMKSKLSFTMDDEDEDEEGEDSDRGEEKPRGKETSPSPPPPEKRRRMVKNPDVDTSFLPDQHRQEEENRLREHFRQEWAEKQERLKNEEIEITFSYWDGAGHRRSVKMKKGNSIHDFLHKALMHCRPEFSELKTCTVDNLVYIKEDLIIPHHYTFYDFIVTKARGKSGPLFAFDVHDDVRMTNDASVEKDESHAGKVVLRSWYEKNKHTFPACRWEPYDPEKKYDKYTISDSKNVGVK